MDEQIYASSQTSFEQKIARAVSLYESGSLSLKDTALFLGVDESEVRQLLYERGALKPKTVLVLGGAGFIGSNFVRYLIHEYPHYNVVTYDKLTYAGNLQNLREVKHHPKHSFIHADIADAAALEDTMKKYAPDFVVNFAAETHVDRSIHRNSNEFVMTNVVGVHTILHLLKKYAVEKFVHISTDEVYGALDAHSDDRFEEHSPLSPRNPYSATKAAADHLCLSHFHTHGAPVVIARPSNNFGPYQYPEKMIPFFIYNALHDKPLPVYGDGRHVREWLFVADNCRAIDAILHEGKVGEVYNIGGGNEKENIEVVRLLLEILNKPYSLITFVKDRPGHDRRYALSSDKIQRALGWRPKESFEKALVYTVGWYRDNYQWMLDVIKRGTFYDNHAQRG